MGWITWASLSSSASRKCMNDRTSLTGYKGSWEVNREAIWCSQSVTADRSALTLHFLASRLQGFGKQSLPGSEALTRSSSHPPGRSPPPLSVPQYRRWRGEGRTGRAARSPSRCCHFASTKSQSAPLQPCLHGARCWVTTVPDLSRAQAHWFWFLRRAPRRQLTRSAHSRIAAGSAREGC